MRLAVIFWVVLLCSCADSDIDYTASAVLQEVALTPQLDDVCVSYYGALYDEESMICAGDLYQDSCQGDSGGPLIYESDLTLLGIVSWGPETCANTASPYGGYTNVYNYIEWIESKGSLESDTTDDSGGSFWSGLLRDDESEATVSGRIVNGVDAEASEHEYFVALMSPYPPYYYPFCGGSYLGDGLVVTAAHCVDEIDSSDSLYLLVGNYSSDMAYVICEDELEYCTLTIDEYDEDRTGAIVYTGSSSEVYRVTNDNITVHPDWNDYTFENDIALIELDEAPSNTALNLPTADTFTALAEANAEDSVLVVGHGDTDISLGSFDFYLLLITLWPLVARRKQF